MAKKDTKKDPNDPLLPILRAAVKVNEDATWSTNAMAKLTLRMKDGSYKVAAVAVGDPLLLFSGVRHGKNADYIFEFTPFDDRPYAGIEMDETKVFAMLPGFEAAIVKAMGYGPEEVGSEITDAGIEMPRFSASLTFGQARAKFKSGIERAEKARKAAASVVIAGSEAERYVSNPLWGAF